MATTTEPYALDLLYRGFIEGITIKRKSSSEPLCHYFGGIPYALPPVGPFRWRKPRSLPPCYRYGTRANPGRFTGGAGVCPQPSFRGKSNEKLWEEDCLQCNVWVPIGEPPKGGWPVFFYIHGGFLQFGTPNSSNVSALINETECKAIFVMPAYRLNVFGFLASRELCQKSDSSHIVPNLGFWDLRLALEWTHKNISYFGGNASNITVGGYSAGSHCTFHQLAYDLGLPDSKSVIRRAIMWSNGPGLQPKSMSEAQEQFDELLHVLKIPLNLPPAEKLKRLRSLKPKVLISATQRIRLHQFRAVTDGEFVRHNLFQEIDDGTFARQMQRRGVKLINGECAEEHWVYGRWHPPKDSLDDVFVRLHADYPLVACKALVSYYYPSGELPSNCKDWKEAFGRIYADMQIHMLERGFVDALARHGAADLLYRYRIEWRAKCCDKSFPKEWGATHGSDMAIWFWGNGEVLEDKEKESLKGTFIKPLAEFISGNEVAWGTKGVRQLRTLTPDGDVQIREDYDWERGVKVWDVLHKVGATGWELQAKL